jgi:hypothetical protein
VRDGIDIARSGTPAIACVTEDFLPQARFVAAGLGLPDLPLTVLPHPMAGRGSSFLAEVARRIVPEIIGRLGAQRS